MNSVWECIRTYIMILVSYLNVGLVASFTSSGDKIGAGGS